MQVRPQSAPNFDNGLPSFLVFAAIFFASSWLSSRRPTQTGGTEHCGRCLFSFGLVEEVIELANWHLLFLKRVRLPCLFTGGLVRLPGFLEKFLEGVRHDI